MSQRSLNESVIKSASNESVNFDCKWRSEGVGGSREREWRGELAK